jgi:hypothetical protein
MSCQDDKSDISENLPNGTHKVIVKEVLQSTNYTYLSVDENNNNIWLAVSKMDAKNGETYYYENGMLMENFYSKDLDRTFKSIYFIDEIRTSLQPSQEMKTDQGMHDMKPKIEKADIKLTKIQGGLTVEELFSQRTNYEGKIVKVKGIVSKINPEIMSRNWIHIQDGTEFNEEFDLTVTSQQIVNVGDTIIAEGNISLNKDFGAGYKYDIIMEDAQIK